MRETEASPSPADVQTGEMAADIDMPPSGKATAGRSIQLGGSREYMKLACICRCSCLRSPKSALVCASTRAAPSALTTCVISSMVC